MNPFRFPLARVVQWRRGQLDLEQAKLRRHADELAELERVRAELHAAAVRVEGQVRDWHTLAGRDLAALAGFRSYIQNQERTLADRRAECRKRFEAQQQITLEARRRCRLLDRLEEKSRAEWRRECDRELEQFAAESHLAALVRRRVEPSL
jgi:hypothetical protein